MSNPNPEQIARNYNERWPDRPPLVYSHGWLYGIFMIGNDYTNKSSLYGAYPHGLLERYNVMFNPEGKRVLHIFSGSLPIGSYTRVDIKQEADIQGDVQQLSDLVDNGWDIIFADPPYTKEDSVKYGTKHPNKFKVVKECAKVLRPGGLLVWLDTLWPMFRKKEIELVGTIGLIRSTNHRVRGIFIFKKVSQCNSWDNCHIKDIDDECDKCGANPLVQEPKLELQQEPIKAQKGLFDY